MSRKKKKKTIHLHFIDSVFFPRAPPPSPASRTNKDTPSIALAASAFT